MAGIYIHIPFCKKACHYCDFHFSTSLKNKRELLDSLKKEIVLRKSYLNDEIVNTIYFGGGTPSLLTASEINEIINQLSSIFIINPKVEITLEANPDDISEHYLATLKGTSVNRLSIGIQSFFDKELTLLNRAHTSFQAEQAVKLAQNSGFQNITVDLIYGIPGLSHEEWKKNIQKVVDLGVQHISCYCLTVEKKTALAHFIKTGKVAAVNDNVSEEQFLILMEMLDRLGFVHYEISNFCKQGYHSQHNTNYWKNENYMGIGPSAHSYNGYERQWNAANNSKYIKEVNGSGNYYNKEVLSLNERYNEYILVSLRTMWGCDVQKIEQTFGKSYSNYFIEQVIQQMKNNWLTKTENNYTLTNKGKLFADKIASDLFYIA